MNIQRRQMIAALGIGTITTLSGCVSDYSGSVSLSVNPGGLNSNTIGENGLSIDSYSQISNEFEITSESWGTSREVTHNAYTVSYSNDWVNVGVGTYPMYVFGEGDRVSGATKPSSKYSMRDSVNIDGGSEIWGINEQTGEHEVFGEFVVYTYEITYQYENENQDQKQYYIAATDYTMETPDDSKDGVRVVVIASYSDDDFQSQVVEIMKSIEYPSAVLQEKEPTDGGSMNDFLVEPMRE